MRTTFDVSFLSRAARSCQAFWGAMLSGVGSVGYITQPQSGASAYYGGVMPMGDCPPASEGKRCATMGRSRRARTAAPFSIFGACAKLLVGIDGNIRGRADTRCAIESADRLCRRMRVEVKLALGRIEDVTRRTVALCGDSARCRKRRHQTRGIDVKRDVWTLMLGKPLA